MEDVVVTQVPGVTPAAPQEPPPDRPPGQQVPASRRRGRVLRAGLLAAAVASVVALDAGVVPLPLSQVRPPARPASPVAGAEQVDLVAAKAREAAIRTTLDALTKTFAAGDGAAAAALADQDAPATADVLRTVATNLHVVPGMEASLDWQGLWSPPPTGSEADAGSLTADLRTFVRGYDAAPGVVQVEIGVVRSGDRWFVRNWSWIGDERPPWGVPGLTAVAKPHVLLVGQRRNAAVNARLAARAEVAITDVRRLWSLPDWNGKAVVVALTDTDFLAQWFGAGQAGPGDDDSDGFYVTETTPSATSDEVSGLRAVLATDYLLRDSRVLRADLRYLLTLLSLRTTFALRGLPEWLYYGSGEYTGWRAPGAVDAVETLRARGLFDGTWSALRRGTWKPRFTDTEEGFGEGAKAKWQNEYDTAFLTVIYIADRFGEKKLAALVADVCGGTALVDAAPRDLHITEKQLKSGVVGYARTLAAKV